jgi:hypothetical protein
MTKVLLAIDEEKIKEFEYSDTLLLKNNMLETFKADAQKMVEALIKETEQRILTEAYNLKQTSDYYGDIIDPDHILQLREKYKGVE